MPQRLSIGSVLKGFIPSLKFATFGLTGQYQSVKHYDADDVGVTETSEVIDTKKHRQASPSGYLLNMRLST